MAEFDDDEEEFLAAFSEDEEEDLYSLYTWVYIHTYRTCKNVCIPSLTDPSDAAELSPTHTHQMTNLPSALGVRGNGRPPPIPRVNNDHESELRILITDSFASAPTKGSIAH